MKRSIFLVCLGMLLLALVCASAEELDLSRTGSIALELTGENGQVVSGCIGWVRRRFGKIIWFLTGRRILPKAAFLWKI